MTERGTLSEVEFSRLRQGSYRALAAGYDHPTDERFAQIRLGLATLEEMGVGGLAFAPSLRAWGAAMEQADIGLAAAEHVRLFGSGTDGAICPPVESQQLGSNLVGDPARHAGRIEDLLRRSGLETRKQDRPPDHLVIELELASALCGREHASRRAGEPSVVWLRRQLELVAVLATWVPQFATDVGAADRSGVYSTLTQATAAFILHEHDFIRLLVNDGLG